jgi:hypothetical protein
MGDLIFSFHEAFVNDGNINENELDNRIEAEDARVQGHSSCTSQCVDVIFMLS